MQTDNIRERKQTEKRYPIGIQTFEEIINGKYVYADKTDLLYNLAQGHVFFLSRPQRFGKSLLISTLEAYFKGRKNLFKGLKIDGRHHNQGLKACGDGSIDVTG